MFARPSAKKLRTEHGEAAVLDLLKAVRVKSRTLAEAERVEAAEHNP